MIQARDVTVNQQPALPLVADVAGPAGFVPGAVHPDLLLSRRAGFGAGGGGVAGRPRPVALRQAGAYIAATPGMNVASYLQRLRAMPQWAMASHRLSPGADGSDEQVVASVWALTIDRIRQSHPLAVRLL